MVKINCRVIPKTFIKWYKLPPCIGTHALGLEFGSATQLSKRPGSVWNCLWGNALKRSPGIIRKSRVLYPGPGFLSSATWLSLPKKHYNGWFIILSMMMSQISWGTLIPHMNYYFIEVYMCYILRNDKNACFLL